MEIEMNARPVPSANEALRLGHEHAVSLALAVVAGITAAASFLFWDVFARDVPMGIGNMRGTALTILVVALPMLLISMRLAERGSLRGRFVWTGALGYLAYNAVMFCFAPRFNSYFLLFTSTLALAFWALLTELRSFDLEQVRQQTSRVPVRWIAGYLVVNMIMFAALWLQAVVPATLTNTTPPALMEAGLTQNPVWVLDFAFTFPLMALASLWLWRRTPWGLILGGAMTVMLTIETASIGVDQIFGNLHDPAASLAAVPIMVVSTALGVVFCWLFLRGVQPDPAVPEGGQQ